MTKAEIFFTSYFIIGCMFAAYALRYVEKISAWEMCKKLIIAFFAWPLLLSTNYTN